LSVAVAIATILFGGVISAVITFALNARRDERAFTRQKLESLYTSADRFTKYLAAHHIVYFALVKGDLDLNQIFDVQQKSNTTAAEKPYEQVELLIAIYFPGVRTAYDVLLEARETLSKLTAGFNRAYQTGTLDRTRDLQRLQDAMMQLDAATKALMSSIAALGKRVNSPLGAIWR